MSERRPGRGLVDGSRDTRAVDPRQRAGAAGGEDPGWHPELAETLHRMVYWLELDGDEFEAELRRLEQKYEDAVYFQLIYLLSRLRMKPAEARRCWQEIAQLRATMQERLGQPVDLRVALVNYFVQLNRQLRNKRIIELKLFEQTRSSAYRDELTGLFNQRFFEEYLAQEVPRSERYNTPLSLVMIEIDDFQEYRDRNGHEAGSEALITLARLLGSSLRKVDIAARYEGDEFTLILPETPKPGARIVAERVRASVERHEFAGASTQPEGRLTVSLGVATYPADAGGEDDLVRRADRALYLAQTGGKNQVRLYGESCRSFRRAKASVEGRFRLPGTDSHPLTTMDIGEGGMLFLTDRRLPAATLLDITLLLPRSSVTVTGRVLHAEEREGGRFETAVRFLDLPAKDQQTLIQYIGDAAIEEDDSAAPY